MKRLNARHLAALAALTGLSAPAAFAASSWGPSGEASYEEHQAPIVSLYSRAEVQEAYRQAAAGGWLPRTGEVVAESPAELVMAHAPMAQQAVALAPPGRPAAAAAAAAAAAQEGIDAVASADPASTPQAGSYESPPNTDMLVGTEAGHLDQAGWPSPNPPQAPVSASPDMIIKSQDELALSEGEELVATGDTAPTPPVR